VLHHKADNNLVKIRLSIALACVLLILVSATHAPAQTSAFTYQGRLSETNGLANGLYDLQFKLFSTAVGDTALASLAVTNGLPITNGIFTVALDFGPALFDGGERWLEIGVRPGGNAGTYTMLAPRQNITATPYAIRAMTVPDGSIGTVQLATSAVTAANITNGAIGPAQLASGAAAANLLASGQSAVPSGGLILSTNANDSRLLDAGYFQIGKVDTAGSWERRNPSGQVPSPRSLHKAIWTGSEMIIWHGADGTNILNNGARYAPAKNRWLPISSIGAPSEPGWPSAVWTGTEMIIWGGGSGVQGGGRYNPATDSWSAISTSNAPSDRRDHSAVWTGREMIIWGGFAPPNQYLNNGARYDPVSNTWTSITMVNAPSPRSAQSAVWTGIQVIIWGVPAGGAYTDGKSYDPFADVWFAIASPDTTNRRGAESAVWTGSEMLVWGGVTSYDSNDGGRYDPASDSWLSISANAAPNPRHAFSAVWTGSDLVIWGGYGNGFLNDGALYDPANKSWNPITATGAPRMRTGHSAIWTGTEMLVWGGQDNVDRFNDLFSYTRPRSLYLYSKP
jgi:N-acetylneuraminic acid mutarotase